MDEENQKKKTCKYCASNGTLNLTQPCKCALPIHHACLKKLRLESEDKCWKCAECGEHYDPCCIRTGQKCFIGLHMIMTWLSFIAGALLMLQWILARTTHLDDAEVNLVALSVSLSSITIIFCYEKNECRRQAKGKVIFETCHNLN